MAQRCTYTMILHSEINKKERKKKKKKKRIKNNIKKKKGSKPHLGSKTGHYEGYTKDQPREIHPQINKKLE